jgi:hypothetical protein
MPDKSRTGAPRSPQGTWAENEGAKLHPLHFSHNWKAEVLTTRPLILPSRHFVYPAQVEEVERGAMELLIHPPEGATPFMVTCALGFAGPGVPTGLWSCPDPSWICVAAGGYVYLVDTRDPKQWEQVEYRPVTEIRALPDQQLLIFAGFHSLQAWGREGKLWQTGRLSWDGVQITGTRGNSLYGQGWDMQTDRELEFEVNLQTGEHQGGAFMQSGDKNSNLHRPG